MIASTSHPPTDEKQPLLDCILTIGVLSAFGWLAVYGVVCAVWAVLT